jgi:hypothetical protein
MKYFKNINSELLIKIGTVHGNGMESEIGSLGIGNLMKTITNWGNTKQYYGGIIIIISIHYGFLSFKWSDKLLCVPPIIPG